MSTGLNAYIIMGDKSTALDIQFWAVFNYKYKHRFHDFKIPNKKIGSTQAMHSIVYNHVV